MMNDTEVRASGLMGRIWGKQMLALAAALAFMLILVVSVPSPSEAKVCGAVTTVGSGKRMTVGNGDGCQQARNRFGRGRWVRCATSSPYIDLKVRGVRCRRGGKIALGAYRRFCRIRLGKPCRLAIGFGPGQVESAQGHVSYRGWRCFVSPGYEWRWEKCRKGRLRVWRKSGV
jgi:hypothetical protein